MMTHTKTQQKVSRREFLGWMWGASLVGLFGQTAVGLFQFFKPRTEPGAFGGQIVAVPPMNLSPAPLAIFDKGDSSFHVWKMEGVGIVAALHPFGLHRSVARRRRSIPLSRATVRFST